MNLNKFLAAAGICSRRNADLLIKAGQVTVNGEVVEKPYYEVEEGDVVKVDGKVARIENKIYILLNKPKGYITTVSDEKDRKTVLDLVDISERVFPVGRLDRNTTGLLILTNDGDLSQRLSHPKYEVIKIYDVSLDRPLKPIHLHAIRKGITLDDGFIKVDQVDARGRDLRVMLHSGRNRIVRRIFEHFGYEIKRLDRISYAGLSKSGLPAGQWRHLTQAEIMVLSEN